MRKRPSCTPRHDISMCAGAGDSTLCLIAFLILATKHPNTATNKMPRVGRYILKIN